jgi:molybdopterin-dependent oxidoreductase alpha subunit
MKPHDGPIEGLKVGKPRSGAAGLKSVLNTIRFTTAKAGMGRGAKLLLELNQKGGIDCQSCAWPDPEDRSKTEFCENGAKAMADEATKRRVTAQFFAENSVSDLLETSEHWLNRQGRLTQPMLLRENSDHYEPIEWDEAFGIIAEELNSLSSPDEAAFYTSGRTSNEAAFLYQLFARQFGTNNLPDCSNMCHESTSVALTETLGLGKASVRLEDLESADLIIVIGQNPGTNAPRMMTSLRKAKMRGARIIAVNPLREVGLMNFTDPNPEHYDSTAECARALLTGRGTELTDLHLPVRIGGDMALLKGLMKIILEREKRSPHPLFDYGFITAHTSGYEDFIAALEAADWNDILEQSGLPLEPMIKAADMFLAADKVVTCWAMGVTQHRDSVDTIKDIVNLHLLRGQIGKPGAGLLPVRGHSNVQGDRTVGIWNRMNPAFRENLEREFGFKTPEGDGLATVDTIHALEAGTVKVFIAMGGNFVSASPDSEATEGGMRKCRLTVSILTKLNRSALVAGRRSLILPCLGRSEMDVQPTGEQFVSTENTILNVQMSKGTLEPASEHLRSEPWIVCRMAKRVLGHRSTVDWDLMAANYDKIRDSIARVVPGFDNYNRRIREEGGFFLPNPPRERVFPTPDGTARFTPSRLRRVELAEGQLLMTSIRSHDQFNTTVYELDDVYRGIRGSRRVVFMNRDDIAARGLREGEVVDITSHFNGERRRAESFAVVPYEIPKGCCATYFPEANVLVPLGSKADKSGCPTSKQTVVTVAPHLHEGERVFAGEFSL